MHQRPHVLISAYALSPTLGSEYGVAWNFITRLSRDFRLTVLYGTGGSRMGVPLMLTDQNLAELELDTKIIQIKPNAFTRFLDLLNHKVTNFFFPFALSQYQRTVLSTAANIIKHDPVAICHQLNPIGYRQPGLLHRLSAPFVWGPIGGMSDLHPALLEAFTGAERRRQIIRNWSNWFFLRYSSSVREAFLSASELMAATNGDSEHIRTYFMKSSAVVRENAVRITRTPRKTTTPVRFVFCGTINQAKGLELVIDSLSLLSKALNWELHVIGEGPERKRLEDKSRALQISSSIIWYGQVSRNVSNDIMNNCDILLMPSYMDSNPTVLLEAFECGIPAVCLNQHGAGDLLDEKCGVLIEIDNQLNMQKNLACSLTMLLENAPQSIDSLKSNVIERRNLLYWEENICKVRDIYNRLIYAG